MTLSEELTWRGFVNQTTYKDIAALNSGQITFYWGVDPSADSMQVGNFAMAMMVRHFIDHGHKAILLVGGATGMIGDPDGKKQERDLQTLEQIDHNKQAIAGQYQKIFAGKDFEIVDNYDWFKNMGYLNFLRDVGKHVPMRQMLSREFVQSRLGEEGDGISYAEFSYSLIQGYDFLHLLRDKGVTLQVAGADQWGNSIAGVELIRRIEGAEAHVWTGPLVVNKTTGVKFGKSEDGAIWLDPAKTTPTQFYQFWINCDDAGVEDYLKIYTLLSRDEIDEVMSGHRNDPPRRLAQRRLAEEVTILVHGNDALEAARIVTDVLVGNRSVGEVGDEVIASLKSEIPYITVPDVDNNMVADVLKETGLTSSRTEGMRLIDDNAISINGQKIGYQSGTGSHSMLLREDFTNGRLLIRRGKAFKDSALVELEG